MGHRRLSQHKTDEALEYHLRLLHFSKTAAGLDDTYYKEQHQQGTADGLACAVDALDDRPDRAALELLQGGTEELPASYSRFPERS